MQPPRPEFLPRADRPASECVALTPGYDALGLRASVSTDRPETAGSALQLHGVAKHFGSRRILDGVSLELRAREVLALCGPSGCGKTTLLRIISGLLRFEAGQVQVADQTIHAQAAYPAALYGRIGVVFQEYHLFPHLTALGNVTLALREAKGMPARQAQERGMDELVRLGASALAQRYPATLSGGEKARVAIARALATEPLLLLLDEPTANLDPAAVEDVCCCIIDLAQAGTTMVLVTHNITCARRAATSFALLQGGLCEYSRSADILDGLRAVAR